MKLTIDTVNLTIYVLIQLNKPVSTYWQATFNMPVDVYYLYNGNTCLRLCRRNRHKCLL